MQTNLGGTEKRDWQNQEKEIESRPKKKKKKSCLRQPYLTKRSGQFALSLLFFFWPCLKHTKFPSQGLNMSQISNQSHQGNNAGFLTCGATKELLLSSLVRKNSKLISDPSVCLLQLHRILLNYSVKLHIMKNGAAYQREIQDDKKLAEVFY